MPKFAKRFLIGCAVILVAACVVLLSINIYLQSGGVQERIRNAASKALGAPITVGSTSYTPWSGLVMRNLRVPEPHSPDHTMIEATALRLRVALFPLLSQRFIVTECSLFEPKLTVRQLATGDWIVPMPPARTPELTVTAQGDLAAPSSGAKGPSFKAELKVFRMVSATLAFINAKGQLVLFAEKCDIDANIFDNLTATGLFEVSRMEIGGSLKPKHIKGPFGWDGKVLELPDIQAQLANGRVTGKCRIESSREAKFDLSMNLKDVQLKRLFSDASLAPGKTEGTLQGDLTLQGDPRTSDTLNGNGHFELVQAKLKPVDILSKIGDLLNIDELRLLQLSQATVDLAIHDKRVQLTTNLISENLQLTGQGPIRFNGKMNIDAKLRVNQKLQQQLQGLLSRNFVQSDDPAYREVAFSITGKVDDPKTDLVEKLTGVNINPNVGDLFKNFFRSAPKKSSDGN